jgi:hypothetical protein
MADTPFESLDSAREYVCLLDRQLEDVRAAIQEDIDEAVRDRATRRGDALRLVDYKLKQLADHLRAARRIMNDLQMLRRLLVGAQEAMEPVSRPGPRTGR